MTPGLGIPPITPSKDAMKLGTETARVPGLDEFTLSRGPVTGPFGYMEGFSAEMDSGVKISATQQLDVAPDGSLKNDHVTTTYRIVLPGKPDETIPTTKATIVTFQTHQSKAGGGGAAVASTTYHSLLSDNPLPFGCTISEQEYVGKNPEGEPGIIADKYGDLTRQEQIKKAASALNRALIILRNNSEIIQAAVDEKGQPLSAEMGMAFLKTHSAFTITREAVIPILNRLQEGKLTVEPSPPAPPKA